MFDLPHSPPPSSPHLPHSHLPAAGFVPGAAVLCAQNLPPGAVLPAVPTPRWHMCLRSPCTWPARTCCPFEISTKQGLLSPGSQTR
ncbi:Uncharacterised protein [Chlamydia abortus]|nr:Uncharacterised protein [Chlamydia abortus]